MASGETMPRRYTPDGHNVSPPITWSGLPEGTREIAVVCADFGAGSPPPWVHWIVYGIPATAGGLPEGLPILPETPMPAELDGAIQGLNGWRRPYYRGPAPPAGTPHLYHFTVCTRSTRPWGSSRASRAGSCSRPWRATSSGGATSCRSTSASSV